jgi:regulator of protease activity HflC (stomatin/prohibitin superfamily)
MSDPSDDDSTSGFSAHELRARLKQITQPIVDSLDSRLSAQVDKRVDQRVDESMKDRLSVIERAIADLDRTVHELQDRLNDAKKTKEKD